MHEVALLTSVVGIVAKTAAERGAKRVTAVAVQVGDRSGVVPDALVGAWPIASADSIAEGAELIIERIPAAVWCPACNAEREIDEYYALLCPVCESPAGELVKGREFLIAYIDLDNIDSS